MSSGLSLYVIEDALTELMAARDELLFAGVTEETSAELVEVDKALAEYCALEIRKVDGIHSFLRWSAATSQQAKLLAAEYRERASRIEANAGRLKQFALDAMATRGLKRIDGTAGRYLSRRGNGGIQPLEIQEDILPDAYRETTVVIGLSDLTMLSQMGIAFRQVSTAPSQSRIREALACGEDVPGAHLLERGEHLEAR